MVSDNAKLDEQIRAFMRFTSREISIIIVLSALGGGGSAPIGHLGNSLKSIPLLPFGTPQIISGLHVLWILLSGILVKKLGSCTFTGILKGFVELVLFNYHGVLVLLISSIEGVVMDLD